MRLLALTIGIVLVIAACGGDSSDPESDDGGDQTDTTQVETTQATPDDADSPQTTTTTGSDMEGGDADSEGSGPSTATVTLGDETYDFSTEGAIVAQCLTDLFGIFSIQLPMVDESGAAADGNVAIIVLREGVDPEEVGEVNSIEVSVGDEDWIANEADMMFEQSDLLEPGMSQVDSVEVDGRTVRGTATFFRQNSLFGGGEVETITGSFEGTCGEERTS